MREREKDVKEVRNNNFDIPALCPSHLTKLDDDDDEFITI